MGCQINGKTDMRRSGKIILLTGSSEIGKTALCLKLIEKLKSLSLHVAGVISPPVYNGSQKTGIDLIDISSGEKHSLATLNTGKSEGLFTHKWLFDEESTQWGNQRISEVVSCDVFIIDELGPLEFDHGLGFINGFKVVDARNYETAILVIRPSLVQKAINRWPDGSVITITLDNRDFIEGQLIDLLSQ
jgi:nucleoside-triphosphatase THEP1